MLDDYSESCKNPIFILSCVRSGSTLLRCIIDTHPNLCSPGHLNLGVLCNDLYTTAYYSIGKLPEVETAAQRDCLAIDETRRVISNILSRYTQGKGKRNWCEKSTENIDHLDILHKVFPNAKYICLYRNSLDVTNSCLKFSPLGYMDELAPYIRNRPTNFVAGMIDNWLDKNKKLLAFEREYNKQCIRVNYESLVQEPERVLAELFGFLGETWDEKLIESIFRLPHDQGDGDVKVWFSDKINKDSIGNGTAIPLATIPKDLVIEVNTLHQELGYPSVEMLYAQQNNDTEKSVNEYDLSDFFNTCALKFEDKERDELNTVRGRCKFVISGTRGGIWVIDSNAHEIKTIEGDDTADCTISTTYNIFCDVMDGNKNAVNAYEQGEIVGDGNVILALEFGRVLFGGR